MLPSRPFGLAKVMEEKAPLGMAVQLAWAPKTLLNGGGREERGEEPLLGEAARAQTFWEPLAKLENGKLALANVWMEDSRMATWEKGENVCWQI